MVLCMSCLAMLIEISLTPTFRADYLSALPRNYPTGLVLQLIIAGPAALLMLKVLQERTAAN